MLNLKPPKEASPEIELPPTQLPTEDGVPLETNWHRMAMNLLIEALHFHWRDRRDYFVGGNMFIYFSMEQVRNRDYRGPDFFVVKNVDGRRDRDAWIVWEEEGRYPNLIIELASPSTIETDLGEKKALYEKSFRTPEYFVYNPADESLLGWQWTPAGYIPLEGDEKGWLWSRELDLWLGTWRGEYQRTEATWLRFFTPEGKLVPTPAEAEAQRAKAEAQRAKAEAQRAKAAEAEVARLRKLLAERGLPAESDSADPE